MRAMTRPVAAAALLAAAGLGAGAPAEEPNTNAAPRAVFSASRRFAVKGLPSADALALALAAEDAAGRLESFLGQPIPFSRNQPIVLAARSDAAAPGRAVGIQGWTDRGLVQKLEITNVERLDQEIPDRDDDGERDGQDLDQLQKQAQGGADGCLAPRTVFGLVFA